MRHQLLLTLFLLATTHTTQAQCNPKEYTKIFNEANALLEKGQFIEAKNRYEAAKIYACNQKQKDAADGRVDALFEQIERLRFQADSSAEAARQALEKLQSALDDIVRLTIKDADKNIYLLDYEGALRKILPVMSRSAAHKELSDALLEIVFFFAESGRFERAKGVLDTVRMLNGASMLNPKELEDLNSLEGFRDAIKTFNAARLEVLDARYFPNMLSIPGGTDTLGSEESNDEKPRHTVTLLPFKLAKSETTWWQYNLFCEAKGKVKPSMPGWGSEGDNPVVNVSWYDAVEYANWLNERMGLEKSITRTGPAYTINLRKGGFRLPTESEWEYAARAGIKSIYAGSDNLELVAWYENNSSSRTHTVAVKKSNNNGLYDMSGNTWEWCWDRYGAYNSDHQANPLGPDLGSYRVGRGGSWSGNKDGARVSRRSFSTPVYQSSNIGFRVASSVQ